MRAHEGAPVRGISMAFRCTFLSRALGFDLGRAVFQDVHLGRHGCQVTPFVLVHREERREAAFGFAMFVLRKWRATWVTYEQV